MKLLRSAVAGLSLLLLVSCSGGSTTPSAQTSGGSPSALPSPADEGRPGWAGPNFTVETFAGETFQLAAGVGRPVVLNFFESW